MNQPQPLLANGRSGSDRLACRRGLSVLEFVGCLMALVGGVWLGAIYLGIDLHKASYVALSESKLMDRVPERWRPEVPESEKRPGQTELAESVQNELVALREEISSLRDSQPSEPNATPAGDQSRATVSSADESERTAPQATVVYWNRLGKIVRNRLTLQQEAEKSATADNAAKVATLKSRIGRLSVNAIYAMPIKDVDAELVAFSRELADWYESGAVLCEDAIQIWSGGSQRANNPQLAKEWQQANSQLENEGRLLQSRADALRGALGQQFGVDFPPISKL